MIEFLKRLQDKDKDKDAGNQSPTHADPYKESIHRLISFYITFARCHHISHRCYASMYISVIFMTAPQYRQP